ncbi:hypothetical protein SAMN06298216_4065 [Spirosomataceae bacterium TFI 002]|nr:hypothetical protein SAMN06298216_4065 [Spirosomataceae bacterium TFI 002]
MGENQLTSGTVRSEIKIITNLLISVNTMILIVQVWLRAAFLHTFFQLKKVCPA